MKQGERELDVRRLGRTDYSDVHALQLELVESRVAGRIGDTLLLTEHDPVVTVGRGGTDSVAGVDLPVHEIERGGEATYHGPGQLVAYPIMLLPEGRRDLHRYLRDLEDVVIGVLAELDIVGERQAEYTGVWIGAQKVCSIGVAVRRWITYHGLALNLHTDVNEFAGFRPCGLDAQVMTRVADHVDLPPTNLLGEVLLVKHFCRVFGFALPAPEMGDGEGLGEAGYRPLPLLR